MLSKNYTFIIVYDLYKLLFIVHFLFFLSNDCFLWQNNSRHDFRF